MMGIGGNHPQVVQLIPDLSENGCKNKNISLFLHILGTIIPSDFHIFQRG
jgi:hypothetical protein